MCMDHCTRNFLGRIVLSVPNTEIYRYFFPLQDLMAFLMFIPTQFAIFKIPPTPKPLYNQNWRDVAAPVGRAESDSSGLDFVLMLVCVAIGRTIQDSAGKKSVAMSSLRALPL